MFRFVVLPELSVRSASFFTSACLHFELCLRFPFGEGGPYLSLLLLSSHITRPTIVRPKQRYFYIINMRSPQECPSLLKVVSFALKTFELIISSLSHGSVSVTSGLYVSNSRSQRPYCKYCDSSPAAKPTVYPQSCAPLSPLYIPPTSHFQSPSTPDLTSPYHSQPSSRPTSDVLRLLSSPSPHMSLR